MNIQRQTILTPCYVIYADKFRQNLQDIQDNFKARWGNAVICGYSCKTNNSPGMLQLARHFGMYAEVVSTREYLQAKAAGFEDTSIIFNGPGKGEASCDACFRGALLNIDNLQELQTLTEAYFRKYQTYPEKLGLRINFDLESCVPGQTSTGDQEGRFGICVENGDVEKAVAFLRDKGIRLSGLHIHYTTRTRSLEVYAAISAMVRSLIEMHDLRLDYIDIGGGFWGGRRLEGKPTMEQYAQVICETLRKEQPPVLILEPGSALCSTVAEYWSRVISSKDIRGTEFVLLDGSCLHINPFQVERNAQFRLMPRDSRQLENRSGKQVLCGSTCLEKDRFAVVENGCCLEPGDMVVFENTGAYTMSFVSDFILDRPHEYLEWSADHE